MMHTPGPWSYTENIEACIAFGTADGWEVGSAEHETGVAFVPGSEANARLIAAAPDMLEALETIASGDIVICKPLQQIAREAIAKAKNAANTPLTDKTC